MHTNLQKKQQDNQSKILDSHNSPPDQAAADALLQRNHTVDGQHAAHLVI